MSLSIEMVFECRTAREAAALESALEPDNHPLPKDHKLSSRRRGSVLTMEVTSPRPASCVSSAFSILSDAKLFAELWSLAS